MRLALITGGALLIALGVLLLAAGGPSTARRLGRVAGVVIVLGAVAMVVGAIGRL